jgi:hypothetical protein
MNAACRHRDIERAELASAGFQEGVELTVNEVCEIYVANKHMPSSTRRVFYTNYNNYIFPRFGDRSIVNVTAVEIE